MKSGSESWETSRAVSLKDSMDVVGQGQSPPSAPLHHMMHACLHGRSAASSQKMDSYAVLKYPLTTESAMKKIEDNNTLVREGKGAGGPHPQHPIRERD